MQEMKITRSPRACSGTLACHYLPQARIERCARSFVASGGSSRIRPYAHTHRPRTDYASADAKKHMTGTILNKAGKVLTLRRSERQHSMHTHSPQPLPRMRSAGHRTYGS